MFEFKLPDLGEGVHEGEILHWYVKEGDRIDEDAPLVEVETDKAAVTIPSPTGGKVVTIQGAVGDTITVGSILVVIDDGSDAAKDAAQLAIPEPTQTATSPAEDPSAQSAQAVAPAKQAPAPQPRTSGNGKPVAAAPATRRLARELGIDLHSVPPSGPGGRITSEDVKRYANGSGSAIASGATQTPPSPTSSSSQSTETHVAHSSGATGIPFFEVETLPDFSQWGAVEREALRSIRRKVAHKMVSSMTIVPHVAHMDEADVTELDEFRRNWNSQEENGDQRLTLMAFIIKALVSELKAHKKLNSSLDPHRNEIIYKQYINVGFAADTPKGLMVPVIHGADSLSIVDLGQAIASLAKRARAGELSVDELRGGTFTVTNVGSLGGTGVIPTINYPEAAILGLGRAHDKPVVRQGKVVVRKILPMTLAFDHRLIDGADAARFVTQLCTKLSDPAKLFVQA